MRMIRSFFGGLAVLAAVMFLGSPSIAMERQPGFYGEAHDIALDTKAVKVSPAPHVAVLPEARSMVKGADAHRAVYIRQAQPMTAWRFAVTAYRHIDPHIVAA